jgi:GNAT superfamily N-acetyltransferase
LIAACENWTRGRGLKVLIINVLAKNDKAIAVYERDGFAAYNSNLRKYL